MKRKLILLAVLLGITGILGALTAASAGWGVRAITDAIGAIGEVTYSEESRALIDRADAAIAAADPNLHLTDRVENLALLRDAKIRYVERAITRLYRAHRDREAEETVLSFLSDAREAYGRYFTAEDAGLIHNYQDLLDIEEKYTDQLTAPAPSAFPEIEVERGEIELC